MQQHERVLADLSVHCLQRGDEVGPEERGLIIALIEGHPCRTALSGWGSAKPLSKQRRLAETSRRRNDGQLAYGALVQSLDQSWAWHQAGTRPGHIQLGLEQRACCHLLPRRIDHRRSMEHVARSRRLWISCGDRSPSARTHTPTM